MKIVSNELIIHPAQSTILRYQYTTFIAVCAGQKNTRVGLCYYFRFSIQLYLFFTPSF